MTLDNLRVTFQEFINDNEVLEALLTAAQEYSNSQNNGKPLVSGSLPPMVRFKEFLQAEVEMKFLKKADVDRITWYIDTYFLE